MKTSCLLVALCLFVISANAQTHPHFGLKAGVNIADLKIDEGTDLDPKASLYVGGLAHFHVSRHFAIQPELMFSGQGAKQGDTKLNLGYINLPVLAQYMTGTGFRLQTGPQVGALISAKSKTGGNSVDIKDELNKIDFSWAFGASYVTNSGLGIDARYNLGLSNVNEDSSPKYHNRVFAVGLFYQFRVSSSRHTGR